jgi:zinc protease
MRTSSLCLSLALVLLSLAWGRPVSAEALPDGITKVTTVEGITEYAMPNGLQILLFPDQSKPTITVNVTYRVGSRHEGRGESGMAHLLEHMVFKGTPSITNIWGALEDHGASFNGTTWLDRTNYYETLPASDDNLDFALKMEADRMINSDIAAEELAKEMTVVRNEFERGENSPSAVLSERMMSAAFLWHNYGKSTIGNRSDIERVPVANLKAFYKKYYQPDNAILLVAGQFDEAKTLGLIAKYFCGLEKPTRVLDQTYTEEPAQDGSRLVTLKRVGEVAEVGLVYHIPSGTHAEFPAVQILEDILTGQPSGRLYRKLVVPGLASSVSGVAFALAEPGAMQFSASVSDDQDPQAVLDYMIDTTESVKSVTKEEVERAKARALKRIKMAMTNSGRIGVQLSESIAQGDWRLFFIHRDRLKEVTVEQVQAAAEKYLIESNRTAGIFIPTKESQRVTVPAAPSVPDLVKNYTGSQQIAQGEKLKPEVDYIEQRVERTELPSGIKVALLPIETRGDSVRLSAKLHYGNEQVLTGKTTAAGMIGQMLMRGTAKHTYQELRDEIDKLESSINVGGGRGGSAGALSASIVSDRANLLPSIGLLGEILKQPSFDEKEFETIVNQSKSMVQQMMSEPQALGIMELRRKMSPWPAESIHYIPSMKESLERIESVQLSDVKELYESQVGASYMEVAVVGDFDPAAVKEALEKEFGSWKSPAEYVRIGRPFKANEADSLVINTPDKAMAIVGMGTSIEAKDDAPEHAALTLASYVLGESAKSRLMTRLRHKGGLSYGAGASYSAGTQDPVGSLFGYAICAPQNAKKALSAMQEEIQQWIADGLTDEELEEAKKSYVLKFERSIANERSLAGRLLRGLEVDRTLHFQGELIDKISKLSNAEIKTALTSVFGSAPMIDMMAGSLESNSAKEASNSETNPADVEAETSDKAAMQERELEPAGSAG